MGREAVVWCVFLLFASVFVTYGGSFPPSFFQFTGFFMFCLGLFFIFGPPFRRLAKKHNSKAGFLVLGVASLLMGVTDMSVGGVAPLRSFWGMVNSIALVLAFVGAIMVAKAAKENSEPQF